MATPPVRVPRNRLDPDSRAWVASLRAGGRPGERAVARLYTLLLREARFEVRRRASSLSHPSGADLDELAVQVAGDAVVAILANLDQFRGDSLFTTWARRIAQRGVPAALRALARRSRELPIEDGFERGRMWSQHSRGPHELYEARESAEALAGLIASELTARQRAVFVALTLDGVRSADLARGLGVNRGALYKTLHDARRKLRTRLAAPGGEPGRAVSRSAPA
jgi:RNA polymerase sigma-70 factor (ECF subfamily)